MTTTILETFQITPSPPVAELDLPLTFFDLPWMFFHPIRRLLFYEFPCSKSHFMETLLPKLKDSLSLTLKYYVPLAGNFLYQKNLQKKPIIRYINGDSVTLTILESTKDYDNLIGNHPRDADQFYDFVPDMAPVKDETDYKIVPLLAIQVTVFPGKGICVGFGNNHCVGDASSIVGFITSWASICKLCSDSEFLNSNLPIFDKSVIKDPLRIDDIYWNVMKNIPFDTKTFPLPTERVRATFILNQAHINKLKDLFLSENPGLKHVSSFVVVAAYIWTCFVKSGEEVDENEFFIFAVDARARINPPVPANYFGNCLSYGMAEVGHRELVGSGGFLLAAKAIAEDIKNRVNNKDEILKGAENWMLDMTKFTGIRSIGVSGSPKFDLYSTDFGWGRARKMEAVTIDGEKYSMSLCKSRDFEGGLEVGLSLPKERMDSFGFQFNNGLRYP